jgi:hypothetical protein
VYLKEVLSEVCELVKKGKYHSMYRLKEEYRKLSSSSNGTMNPEAQADDNAVEDDEDDEDEDEEEDEFEQVS